MANDWVFKTFCKEHILLRDNDCLNFIGIAEVIV